MADFIAINFFEQPGRGCVTNLAKAAGVMLGEIQVRLLEGQAQAGDVIHRVFHHGNRAPEIAAHRQFAELNPAFRHAPEVKPRVFLLVLERSQHAFAECGGRLGKSQQHQRHQFGGEQFVVGEKMQQLAAFTWLFQIFRAGKMSRALPVTLNWSFRATPARRASNAVRGVHP